MKIRACFVLLAVLAALPCAALSQAAASQPDYAAIGRATVSAIAQHDWKAVEAKFDPRMNAGLPQEKLAAVWERITNQAGAFQRITGVNLSEQNGYHVARVACAFANTDLDAKIVMDSTGQIAGLFFVPPAPPPAVSSGPPPDYATLGRKTVSALAQDRFASVESRFDARMKTALPPGKLATVWQQIIGHAGNFERIVKVQLSTQDGYPVALIPCVFAKARLDAKVVFDPDGEIAGLFFLPATSE